MALRRKKQAKGQGSDGSLSCPLGFIRPAAQQPPLPQQGLQ